MIRGKGRLRCGFKFAPAWLWYRSNLGRPGRRVEEDIYLFKRALLLPTYGVADE